MSTIKTAKSGALAQLLEQLEISENEKDKIIGELEGSEDSKPRKEKSQMKYKPIEKFMEDDNDWLLTYSDLITLLLTFFVILFSMSTINQSKFEEMQQALNKELLNKDPGEAPFIKTSEELTKLFSKSHIGDEVEMQLTPEGIKIEFSSLALYKVGSAEIKDPIKPILLKIADLVQTMDYENYLVEIEGHTDDSPIKTIQYPSNWELSAARASNIVKFFIEWGIPSSKLKAVGYADTRPKKPNRTKSGKAIIENMSANRRVVIYIGRNS
jgi:chemotaxis protein MotB